MKYKTKQIIEQLDLIAITKGRIFNQQHGACNEAIDIAIDLIKDRPKGKWIKDRYCSCCQWDKKDFDYIGGWKGNFCPNCGADMRGEEE